jgi:hypothetical protein
VLPEGVQAIIDKAMAKSPADRFQSAIELTEAIDAIIAPRVSAEQKVVSPRRDRPTEPTEVAPTMVGMDRGKVAQTAQVRTVPKASGLAGNFFVLLLVLGGAAVALWYLKIRPTTQTVRKTIAGAGSAHALTTDAGPAGAGGTVPVAGKAVPVPGAAGSGQGSAIATSGSAAGSASVAGSGSAVGVTDGSAGGGQPLDTQSGSAADVGAGSATDVGAGSGSGSAVDEVEIDPDPMAAINPDPIADTNEAEDEAEDAPATPEDVEKRVPAAPVRASTVREAVQMLRDGKRDLAFASLHGLWKKSRKSAYIPFLLGNIYNDRMWWSVAMDHYKIAISKNRAYRGNAVLNKNVIKMLASPKTARKATSFIKFTIGRPARPYLRQAAKHHKNPNVRKRAARLARTVR